MAGIEAVFNKPAFSEDMAGLAPTLHERPNQVSSYIAPEHQQLIEKIDYLTRYSPYIEIILGAAGSGKTTLLEQLIPTRDSDLLICRVDPQSSLSQQALIRTIYAQIAPQWYDPAVAPEPAIFQTIQRLAEGERALLVVVDNAEQLEDDAITWLLNDLRQQLPEGQNPHLVLFANPNFTRRINNIRALRESIEQHCHFLEIPPLSPEDLRAFVKHHYGALAAELTEAQWSRLVEESHGLPGRIIQLMDKANVQSATGKADSKVFIKLTTLVLIAALGLGLTAWLAPEYFLTEEQSIRVELPVPIASTTPKPATTQDPETALKPATSGQTPAVEATQSAPPNNEAEASIHVEALAKQPMSDAEVASLMDTLKAPPSVEAEDAADTEVLEPAKPGKLTLNLPPVEDQNLTSNSTLPETGMGTRQPSQRLSVVETTPETQTSPEANTTVAKPNGNSMVTNLSKSYLRQQELLAWSPESYTLQMLGARKENSVVQFIQSQSNRDSMYYFATEFKGKPWYVVVFGNYPDRKAAYAALRKLPDELKKYKPWPRSAAGIQDDIRRVQQ